MMSEFCACLLLLILKVMWSFTQVNHIHDLYSLARRKAPFSPLSLQAHRSAPFSGCTCKKNIAVTRQNPKSKHIQASSMESFSCHLLPL
jgi:hypothetical protein